MTGTQIQAKLGPLVDTSMAVQLLSKVLPLLPAEDALRGRVDKALDVGLLKLQGSQQKDGSWGGGGWAPVLQSSLGCSALELAQASGKTVDVALLTRARSYQKSNFDAGSGRAESKDGAGVELYALAGSQRAAAGEARAAMDAIEQAKVEGKLDRDAPVNEDNLKALGYSGAAAARLGGAFEQNEAVLQRLDDEKLLQGFGNNGGEEYLSYLMTSESLVIAGGDQWEKWNDKMHERLSKIQTSDGSWTGHHCITSPVFCTAAVAMCLTADREASTLLQISADANGAEEKK
jgi:hypothetical protein